MLSESRQILISLCRLLARENLNVNDWVDIVRLNGSNRVPHHGPEARDSTAGNLHLVKALEHALRNILATK